MLARTRTHTHVHTYTHAHTHTYTHAHTHAHTEIWTIFGHEYVICEGMFPQGLCMCVCIHIYICIYLCIHVNVCTCVYVQVHVCVCVCVYVCMYVCMCASSQPLQHEKFQKKLHLYKEIYVRVQTRARKHETYGQVASLTSNATHTQTSRCDTYTNIKKHVTPETLCAQFCLTTGNPFLRDIYVTRATCHV